MSRTDLRLLCTRLALVAALASPLAVPTPAARAEAGTVSETDTPTPYEQGKFRVGLSGGGGFGSRDDIDFFIVGSFGVFVVDNLELGVDLSVFVPGGDAPLITQLGPTARYIFPVSEWVHPYVGAFYNHWFIGDGFDDVDTVGGRAGILVRSSTVFVSIGLAIEQRVSTCDEDCLDWYPEFGVSFVL